ncbi:MAG: DUF4340 domain-containing protein [Oscillospiraceae bacterium]|nr:DUF4340 domain-containing protein [Oscillospiraceae bacterium]
MSIKKIRALIIALVVLAALSITAYLAVDKIKTNEENQELQEAQSLNLFSFDSNAVNQVQIQNPDGNFTIQTTSTSWEITESSYAYDFTLNAYYINSICSYMSDLTALKKLDVPAEELPNYGFSDPVTVTCYDTSNIAYTIYIGNPAATQEYYYAMRPDDPVVYEIDFNEGDVLRGGMTYLRSHALLDCSDVDITSVRLERDSDVVFDLLREENTWEMLEPLPNAQVHSANINSYLTSVTRTEVENFVKVVENSADLVEYHLDHPACTLTVKTNSGATTTIDFAAFDSTDKSIYLVIEETGQIATLPANSAGFLQTQPAELLSDKVFSPNFEDVSKLDIQVDDLKFSMIMDHEEKTYLLDDLNLSEQEQSILNLYQFLFKTVSNISYDSLDLENPDSETDSNPDSVADPTVLFTYTMLDGSVQEVSLIPIDDTYYQAYINDEYSHKIVRRRSLSGSTGVLTYYEKMTDALAELDLMPDSDPNSTESES